MRREFLVLLDPDAFPSSRRKRRNGKEFTLQKDGGGKKAKI
jgi:hypothetical protein